LKLEEEWTAIEDELSLRDSKALNALFNGVDKNMFKLIMQCTVAKDAWEILKSAHEGTPKVKSAKLQLLTTKFENLRMLEDESIQDYHLNILDITDALDSLGEKISEEKLVRKILRSLPKKFDMKVSAVEEAQDLSNMKVDELIGSVQNFEIVINNREEKKESSITLLSNNDPQVEYKNDELLTEAIVLFGKQFNKVQKQAEWKPISSGQNILYNINEQLDNVSNPATDDERNQPKGVQCHECEGFGHIKTECATFLKKQKKSLFIKVLVLPHSLVVLSIVHLLNAINSTT